LSCPPIPLWRGQEAGGDHEYRRAEAAEWHQTHVAQLMATGQQPRAVSEILAVAALYP